MTWLEDKIAGSTVLILAEKHCSDVDAAKEFCLKAGEKKLNAVSKYWLVGW